MSAEIRWYSPFLQNEFIRGGRGSHCRESRFVCDKGCKRQIGGKKKEFHFLFLTGGRYYQGISTEAGLSEIKKKKKEKEKKTRERTDGAG